MDDNENVPICEPVRQEILNTEDHGESELDQLKAEVGEQEYMLSSPLNNREDVAFTNINAD